MVEPIKGIALIDNQALTAHRLFVELADKTIDDDIIEIFPESLKKNGLLNDLNSFIEHAKQEAEAESSEQQKPAPRRNKKTKKALEDIINAGEQYGAGIIDVGGWTR